MALILLVEERSGGTVAQTQPLNERPHDKARFVYRGLTVPFMLLAFCFAAWGSAANLTDVMVGVFRHIFVIRTRGGTDPDRVPRRVLLARDPRGLHQQAVRLQDRRAHRAGSGRSRRSAFFPASKLLAFGPCLVALFVLAAGLSILETSANPSVIAMGPEGSATQRLNLAQAFNPVGANIGVLLGAVLILPRITTPAKTLTAPQLHQAQGKDLSLVLGPYLGIAVVLVLMGLLMAACTALSEGLYLAARRCERSVSR